MWIGDYETHPAADAYPLMHGDEFAELVEDVRTRGLLEAVLLIDVDGERRILDGRNRLRACLRADVEPRYEDYSGPADERSLVEEVRSRNLHRRHLTASQRALLAAGALPLYEEVAQDRMAAGVAPDWGGEPPMAILPQGPPAGASRDQAGTDFGVSGRSVQTARRAIEAAPLELVEAIRAGVLTVTDVDYALQFDDRHQVRLLREVEAGNAKTLRAAHRRLARPQPKPELLPAASPQDAPERFVAEWSLLTDGIAEVTQLLEAARKRTAAIRRAACKLDGRGEVMKSRLGGLRKISKEINETRTHVESYRPAAVCPDCEGAGCDFCEFVGWISTGGQR